MSDTWVCAHLVLGVRLLSRPHVVLIWGYMLQGWPFPVRRTPTTLHSHLESNWTPPQQAQLDPLIALIVVPSRPLSFSVHWQTWLALGCCNVKQRQTCCNAEFRANYGAAKLHSEACELRLEFFILNVMQGCNYCVIQCNRLSDLFKRQEKNAVNLWKTGHERLLA